VDLRPTNNLLVQINAGLNASTGVLTWQFTSLDPATHQPPTDPSAGFLPPGGIGSVFFTVMPKHGLATNTQIQNQASIVFDVNPPMSTATWVNTLDNTAPTSHVVALPSIENSFNFPVQWTGTDVGAGIQDFTVNVSDNGGPFTAFQVNTTATSATFSGQDGHTYGFYSIARDLVGNVESGKTSAEATTRVISGPVCATDVSAQVQVTRSGYSYNLTTGRFVQTVTLKNPTNSVIPGSLSLVLDNLSSNATLFNQTNTTACAAPSGSPYINLSGGLNSGASASVVLQFTNPTRAGITYATRVLSGSASR
jgi:hypothetical protein